MSDKQVPGSIEVSAAAIARLASHAVLQCYGVVGMAAPNLASGIAAILTRDPNRGIGVKLDNGEVIIDVYIVVEYGTRIATVADIVIDTVRFQVEQSSGIPVRQINVHVQGVRVSEM